MSKKRKIVLVGCGKSGRLHTKCYGKFADKVDIIAVIDPSPKVGKSFEGFYSGSFPASEGFPQYFSSLEAFAQAKIINPLDCIMDVCVPNAFHYEIVNKVVELGFKKVLVEKPLADSIEESIKFGYLDANIAVVENYLYSNVTLELKRIIKEQKFIPKYVRIEFSKDRRPDTMRNRGFHEDRQPHLFFVEVPHQIAVAHFLFGDVKANLGAWCNNLIVEGKVFKEHGEGGITLLHDSGVISYSFSCLEGHNHFPLRYRGIRIYCDNNITLCAHYPIGGDDAFYGVVMVYEKDDIIKKYSIKDDNLTYTLDALTESLSENSGNVRSNIALGQKIVKVLCDNINIARIPWKFG